jgi:TPP-dependent pyruvate/acetoin dehydrogenase alpha subunit
MATKPKDRLETAVATAKSSNGTAPLPEAKLKQLYATMLKCRTMEEKIRILFKQGRFSGNYYAAVGQEATEVGCAIDLRPTDTVAPSHRDFIANLIKGTPLNLMISQIYARKTSPDQGRSSPAHCGYAPLNIITPASTIAAQLNIGTGVALANKMQKKEDIVMAFSGEGSTSLGFWHEAVNFAAVHNLPIVYVIQNNLWAESVTVKLQSKVEDLSLRAQGYGIPGITVDGNDVVAVYRVATEAINRARTGGGPTIIECKTYRWYGHSEIDPAKYRDPAEVEYWKSRDPLPFMENYLTKYKLWSDDFKQQTLESFQKELDAAIDFAEKAPYPEPEEALDHVYSFSIRDRELDRKTWTPTVLQK